MGNESNKSEEIDLILIFSKIKLAFVNFGNFFLNIFRIALKRWVLLLIISLLGAGIGIGLFFLAKPVYISSFTLSSNTLSNDFCADIIEDLELIIKDNTPEVLAKKLKIDTTIAKEINALEFQNYDEKLKKLYKDKDTVVLGRPFKIIAYTYNNKIFSALQKALVDYLENNEYALKRKELKMNNILLMREKLKGEIHQLDSLKFVVAANLLPRGSTNGFVFGQPLDPINVYKEGINLFQDDLNLNSNLVLIDNIQVIKDFSPRAKQDSPKLVRNIVIYGFVLFVIGLIFVFFLEKKEKIKKV